MTAPTDTEPSIPLSGGPPTDAVLVQESWRMPERFAVLFDRHGDEIHRYVARLLGAQAAEDVVAETFLTAFRKRTSYDTSRPDARPWLYGIATLAARQQRRAEMRRHRVLAWARADHPADTFDDRSAERVTAQRLQPRLAKVLAGLPAADRDLLLLIAWAELSYEEAAEALGIPIGTVKSRLHRIRKKVRRAFGDIDPLATYEEPRS
nr:RNA polymerase sigma factor [Thermomonospora echinospora]